MGPLGAPRAPPWLVGPEKNSRLSPPVYGPACASHCSLQAPCFPIPIPLINLDFYLDIYLDIYPSVVRLRLLASGTLLPDPDSLD